MACHLLPPIDLLTYYSLTCWLVDSSRDLGGFDGDAECLFCGRGCLC